MDGQQTQDQQTKDFMSSFFPQDLPGIEQIQNSTGADQFQFHPTPQPSNSVSMANNASMSSSTSSYNPALLLEQQYKLTQLQQLQQLQNQFFSSSQTPALPLESESRERVVPFHGLPTPGRNSTELRAQSSVEYVSPMILDYSDTYGQHQHQQYPPRGSTSAPAHIAFRTTSTQPDLDFDISPLTSPWLGAHQQPRNASSSEDEATGERPSRKKHSPAIRATVPIPKKTSSRSKSANSTPLLRSTRSRKDSIGVPGDTPSPVDLSMPPPAPPADSSSSNNTTSVNSHVSPGLRPQLTPVTPASIMNLGRLGITSSLAKPQKKSPASASPGLKAILPGASAASGSRQAHPPVQVRKTSHKAAEQKRRDSLKTTFDDLRGTASAAAPPVGRHGRACAPGALPPRGPPKAGGEGPNKGVSKLQC
ncbi:hypothetical protein B0H13DRAFT_1971054 [Mycena leptocephala]|nr:hypothetical protein B0H13DRAFT_1971054 [Mycena leptocephala]